MPKPHDCERMRRSAIFLDRDGTLIHDTGYLADPLGVVLLPGVRQALRQAHRRHRLFLFSNQSGISRGYCTWEDVEAVNDRMFCLLGNGARLFDAVCMAAEHPDMPLVYRKPSPRFILESIDQFGLDPDACWMVGDKMIDLQVGMRAGVRAALVTGGATPDAALAVFLRRHALPSYFSLAEFVATNLAQPICQEHP